MALPIHNLFAAISSDLPQELIEVLAESPACRIVRIVSHGHASSDGFWYDQEQDEWVIVLQGTAKLVFDGAEQPLEMRPGDWVDIPAHTKHRVEWTTPDEPTVWLAVYYEGRSESAEPETKMAEGR